MISLVRGSKVSSMCLVDVSVNYHKFYNYPPLFVRGENVRSRTVSKGSDWLRQIDILVEKLGRGRVT